MKNARASILHLKLYHYPSKGVLCMRQREGEVGRQRRESQKEAREEVVVVEPLRGR